MVERAGEAAKLGFKSHPHIRRHACGFALANKGHRALQAYLGTGISDKRFAIPSFTGSVQGLLEITGKI
jgi:integrase